MEPEIVHIDGVGTVAVRVTGDMASLDIGRLFAERLGDAIAAADEVAGPSYARYHEFGPDRFDIELGVPGRSGMPPAGVDGAPGASSLPGGTVARILHRGHYASLPDSFARLDGWIDAQGLRRRAAPWESYLDDPGTTIVDDLRTEIVWPVVVD